MKGFTLIELLFATIATAALLLAVGHFSNSHFNHSIRIENEAEAERQMRAMNKLLRNDFTTRYSPQVNDPLDILPADLSIPNPAVLGSSSCQGIQIVRRHLDSGILETVRYETVCVPKTSPTMNGTIGNVPLTCSPTEQPVIRVTRWPDSTQGANAQLDFPNANSKVFAGVLCIQPGYSINAMLFYSGSAKDSSPHMISSIGRLDPNDRYDGVELAP